MKDEFDFDNIGRKMSYSVPDDFFNSLTQKTLDNVKEKERLRPRRRISLCGYAIKGAVVAAAMVAAVLIFNDFGAEDDFYYTSSLAAAETYDQGINLALESISESEWDQLAMIAESDIFYTDNLY